jgi:hypothetical protein
MQTLHEKGRTAMKLIQPCFAALVFALAMNGAACGTEPDPLTVVRALMDAESAANLDKAMALFADDAFVINVTGRRTADRQELKWLINSEIFLREDFLLNRPQVEGDTVSWIELASEEFYKSIRVAPVQFVFEAVVQSGKIRSIVAHLPTSEIARIREACHAQAKDPLIHDRPCAEFVQLIEMHTRRQTSTI